jgi:translation elongation factor EF-1alpha
LDRKTGEIQQKKPRFVKQDSVVIARLETLSGQAVCMECFRDFPQLGRFTLRDKGAMGGAF